MPTPNTPALTARFLSLLPQAVAGFCNEPVRKRDLMAGPVALFAPSLAEALALLPDFSLKVEGVIITPGEGASAVQLGPLLWHWTIADSDFGNLAIFIAPTLAAVTSAVDYRETSIRESRTLARVSRDLELNRQDYLGVTKRLQEKVRSLEEAERVLTQNQEKLREANEQLEARVAERTTALEMANKTLTLTVQQLEMAKDEIVRTEKLAALGTIVAGLSHELNTPIGNALMSASTLQDEARKLLHHIEHGLKRSHLTSFVDDAVSQCELLLRNLQKATDLIMGYKQVAVDQTSSQRRNFDLANVVDDVVMTLRPAFRNTQLQLGVDMAPGIKLNSYPGPLGQIIINLVHNALLHAFDGRVGGEVRIVGRACGDDQVELVFTDNGAGIAEEVQGKIFDPFFTTRMGRGGSGLGLNIVHGIVTDILGGSISVASKLGEGTAFSLRLPLSAPLREGGAAEETGGLPMFGNVARR